ncbi:MAG: Hpt domain-containing protein [Planctomycetota bacterium]|jgi:chemotaxis protein histidine kinase CheA
MIDSKEKIAVILDNYLANLPENIHIPSDINEAMLSEFVDSTTSHLDLLEQEILGFEAGQTQNDFVTSARTILHNINGDAGIMDIAEMSDICHLAESLLHENCQKVPIDTLLSVKDWLSKAVQYIRSAGSKLPGYIFSAESMKILGSAEIDLLDLGNDISDAQAVQGLSCAMRQLAQFSARMARPDVKALAGKAIAVLAHIQQSEQCVISDVEKESLFDLLYVMKQHVLNADKPVVESAAE